MLSIFASIACGAAGFAFQFSADFDRKKIDFLEALPEKSVNQIAYEFDHPTEEQLAQARVVDYDKFGNDIVQIPQQTACIITGYTAAFFHELVKASVRRQNNDTSPTTTGIALSNVEDVQLHDTLIERSPEKRDSQGRVIQEAQYTLRREEKPHDEQQLGQFLRVIDPHDADNFIPENDQYICPSNRTKYSGYLPPHLLEAIKKKQLDSLRFQQSLLPHNDAIHTSTSVLIPVNISQKDMRKHSQHFVRPQNFEGIMSEKEHHHQLERSRRRRLNQAMQAMDEFDDESILDNDAGFDPHGQIDENDEVAVNLFRLHRLQEYSHYIDEADEDSLGVHDDDWFLDENIDGEEEDDFEYEDDQQDDGGIKPSTPEDFHEFFYSLKRFAYRAPNGSPILHSKVDDKENHNPNSNHAASSPKDVLNFLSTDFHGDDAAMMYGTNQNQQQPKVNKWRNEVLVDARGQEIEQPQESYWNDTDIDPNTTPRELYNSDPEHQRRLIQRDFRFVEQTVNMSPDELYFDRPGYRQEDHSGNSGNSGQSIPLHDTNFKPYSSSPNAVNRVHRPKHHKDFPEYYITIPRTQLEDELFITHTTHLSISPDTELENILKDGNLWAKVDKPRLVGLKRTETIIPTLKQITLIGEIYRDYDDALKIRSVYDPKHQLFYAPEVTYKTRYEMIDELEKVERKKMYGSYGCYSAAAIFGFNALRSIGNALSDD